MTFKKLKKSTFLMRVLRCLHYQVPILLHVAPVNLFEFTNERTTNNGVTHLFLETLLKKYCHWPIKMSFDTGQGMSLVWIDLLFEKSTLCREGFGKNHALLEMNVVISGAMNLKIMTINPVTFKTQNSSLTSKNCLSLSWSTYLERSPSAYPL